MTIHTLSEEHHHHHVEEVRSKNLFGFWIYIMSDLIMFATLFVCYAVLHHNTFGGVGIKQIATLPYVFVQTLVLLVSSFTIGLSVLAQYKSKRSAAMFWMFVTFVLGLVFVFLELHEFVHLFNEGNSWSRSAFLSSFFVLVGTHGVHMIIGLIWILVLFLQLMSQGMSETMKTRILCLGLFWNFLDIVWIFIYIIVYLMGSI